MPEYFKALVVIFVLATIVFALAGRYVCAPPESADFARRRNTWLVLTLAAFLAHSFWVYTLIAVPLLLYANRHESNPPALFFFLLFVLPIATIPIPGMGVINFIFDLSHARLLELCILLPAFFAIRRQEHALSFGRTGTDKVLACYLALAALLALLQKPSETNSLREAFYLFIDVFLPYFVISRSLKNMPAFRDALLSLVLAIMVLAPIAAFESIKHWLLYSVVTDVLGLQGAMTGYLGRDGILRAIATAGQPIALGYLMVVGMGFYLFVQRFIQNKLFRRLGMLVLAGGLLAALSRGPWIGATILLCAFVATGRYALPRLMGLALAAMFALTMVAILPGGERVINLLPFIGNTETENIDYREQLITNSIIVIKRNIWFGSVNYFEAPEMEAMRQGEGIIDVVNSYIGITLTRGLVGLGLFVSFFAMTLLGIYRAMRLVPDKDSEEYLLGRVLLATLLAILVIIFTVSSITVIPIVYWSVAALGVAYTQMIRKMRFE